MSLLGVCMGGLLTTRRRHRDGRWKLGNQSAIQPIWWPYVFSLNITQGGILILSEQMGTAAGLPATATMEADLLRPCTAASKT